MYDYIYEYLYTQISEVPILGLIIICITVFLMFLIFMLSIKRKWWKSLTIGRSGINVRTDKEQVKITEVTKAYKSKTIDNKCTKEIIAYDVELIDFAMDYSDKLRRTLNIHLHRQIKCASTRYAVASYLRYPLGRASRKNNFKDVLRPENTKAYIDNLIKNIIEEYKAFSFERELEYCAHDDNKNCPELPSLDDMIDLVNKELKDSWVKPIRTKTIEICEKKIKNYETYKQMYKELDDEVGVKIMEDCIEKNTGYKKALSRKPEAGEL